MSMTAAQMAELIDQDWNPEVESIELYAQRELAAESVETFGKALQILIEVHEGDRAFDDIRKVFSGKTAE
ncbi:hypothetical protein LPW26_05940 [Rhodopseudomonas sp. HC1]|uniref:hypothetical protein n=1 Tax=Rhodopseudomonas infernalis TaxID=2897386 RepID=UPI001EE7D617|nr:hypothetical protein [Rhodopseudomonas infernalis]MCG6204167.1 hypothetical protein [Rhodopseudomonas infernalis]